MSSLFPPTDAHPGNRLFESVSFEATIPVFECAKCGNRIDIPAGGENKDTPTVREGWICQNQPYFGNFEICNSSEWRRGTRGLTDSYDADYIAFLDKYAIKPDKSKVDKKHEPAAAGSEVAFGKTASVSIPRMGDVMQEWSKLRTCYQGAPITAESGGGSKKRQRKRRKNPNKNRQHL